VGPGRAPPGPVAALVPAVTAAAPLPAARRPARRAAAATTPTMPAARRGADAETAQSRRRRFRPRAVRRGDRAGHRRRQLDRADLGRAPLGLAPALCFRCRFRHAASG
jgi:hypothetical protein